MAYKLTTNQVLVQYYNKFGLEKTVATARDMLKASNKHRNLENFTSEVHGELCETVLEIMLRDMMISNPDLTKNWFIRKSLVLKDPESPVSDFRTELDVVLFTPVCIFVFECKSYQGSKTLTGQGVLTCKGKDFDVFSQQQLHKEVIAKNFGKFITERGVKTVFDTSLFDFSEGDMIDLRDAKAKEQLPYLNVNTLMQYVICQTKNKPVVFDWKILKQAVKRIDCLQVELHEEHLKYIKGLRNNGMRGGF